MGTSEGVHAIGESQDSDWGRHLDLFYLCLLSCADLLGIDLVGLAFPSKQWFSTLFPLDLMYVFLRQSFN